MTSAVRFRRGRSPHLPGGRRTSFFRLLRSPAGFVALHRRAHLLLVVILLAGLAAFTVGRPDALAAPGICAAPGREGPNATLSGTPNSYWPATASAAAGATAIALGTRNASGAATDIAAGDLLLVMQMQGATIDSTDTSSYGDGTAGGGSGASSWSPVGPVRVRDRR